MKLLGIFITACVVLAAAQAAAAALAILLMVALVYGLFAYPREILGLLGMGLLSGLIMQQPLACLGVLALVVAANAIHRK